MRILRNIILSSCILFGGSLAVQAAGTPQERRDCRDDAFRLCQSVIPDVPRVTACMKQNVELLSSACRAHFPQGRKRPRG